MATARTALKLAAMMVVLAAVWAAAALYYNKPMSVEIWGVGMWHCYPAGLTCQRHFP